MRRAALLFALLAPYAALADADDDAAANGIADRLFDTELQSKNRYASFDAYYDVYGMDGPFWAYGGCSYTLGKGEPRTDCHFFVSLADKKQKIDVLDAGDAKKREAGREKLRKAIRKLYQGAVDNFAGRWMHYYALEEGAKPITFGTRTLTWDAKKRVLTIDDPKEKEHTTLAAPKLKKELDETKAGVWIEWNPDTNEPGYNVLLRVHTESDKGASEDAIVKS